MVWSYQSGQLRLQHGRQNATIPETTQTGTPFNWTEELESLFNESKAIIISDIEKGVQIFA